MRCRWIEVGERDARGYGTVKCDRPGCPRVIYQTPNTPDEIVGDHSCAAWPERHEWGEWIAMLLESATGISKWRYINFKRLLWLSPQCDCNARASWLNRIGGMAMSSIRFLRRAEKHDAK